MNSEVDLERFTRTARRTLFYARAAVSTHGGTAISDSHLLVGLLRAAPELVKLLRPQLGAHRLSECLIAQITASERAGVSVEIPLGPSAAAALGRATRLARREITPTHILLGMLQERPVASIECLRALGVDVDVAETATLRLLMEQFEESQDNPL